MKRIVLTHRLETIALLCDGARVAADIGCDHGRLSCALIKQYGVKKVLASDISEISVQKTRTLAAKCGIGENELTAVRRDGLIGLSCGDADTLVISGMGGELIADIIDRNKPLALSCERIIMQPQRGVEELRAYLRANGFAIYDERVIYDGGRYYQILCAARARKKLYWTIILTTFCSLDRWRPSIRPICSCGICVTDCMGRKSGLFPQTAKKIRRQSL